MGKLPVNICLRCSAQTNLQRGYCGECLKLKGIQQVLAHENEIWKRGALKAVRTAVNRYTEFTPDHVKAIANKMGLGEPHHPNVWGGVYSSALSKGYMYQTGRFVKSGRANQHATRIPVYTTKKTVAVNWERRAKGMKKLWLQERAMRRRLETKLKGLGK